MNDNAEKINKKQQSLLSVVIIGLNEEKRIERALRAVLETQPEHWELEVFYVDSGSTDNSVNIAQSIPDVRVIILDDPAPSAAKGRNEGLKFTNGKYVQLLDGDSIVQPGWLQKAIYYLEQNKDVASVFGHCQEMFPNQSIYMKVCGIDWYIPPGEYRLCGGNALWRKKIFDDVGHFDTQLRYGEEPDLCYNVRRDGWKIVCIDVPMVMHDLGMKTFKQYWQRAENSGKAYASVASRYWQSAEKLWLHETLRNFSEVSLWLFILITGSFLFGSWYGISLLFLWFLFRTVQIAIKSRVRTKSFKDALLYAIHIQFTRLPLTVGQIKALFISSKKY